MIGLYFLTPQASGSKGSDKRGQIFRGGGRVRGCGHEDGTSTAQVPQGWERRELLGVRNGAESASYLSI
jgi:hypothetical protein